MFLTCPGCAKTEQETHQITIDNGTLRRVDRLLRSRLPPLYRLGLGQCASDTGSGSDSITQSATEAFELGTERVLHVVDPDLSGTPVL